MSFFHAHLNIFSISDWEYVPLGGVRFCPVCRMTLCSWRRTGLGIQSLTRFSCADMSAECSDRNSFQIVNHRDEDVAVLRPPEYEPQKSSAMQMSAEFCSSLNERCECSPASPCDQHLKQRGYLFHYSCWEGAVHVLGSGSEKHGRLIFAALERLRKRNHYRKGKWHDAFDRRLWEEPYSFKELAGRIPKRTARK